LLEGEDAACDFVENLAAEAATLDDLRLAWDIGAVARQWLRSDRRDETYVVLRTFELSQSEFDDPDHPGIPLETPERRELIELTRTLPRTSGATLFNPFVGSRAEAQRALDAVASDDGGWVVLGPLWVLGAHRKMRDILNGRLDDLLARGVIAAAVFDLAVLARLHAVLGEYDDAQARLEEGFTLLPRISETSNPALQLFAAFVLQRSVRGELVESADVAGFAPFGDSPDVRWAWIAVTAFRAQLLAQEGNAGEAIDVLHEVLPVIERAGGWAQNYPALVFSVTQILWHLQRTDELETLERNLRTKVVEPDVRYPEASGRVALAQLCALDGRTDEARHWFDDARRVHEEQGNEPLLVAADFDEALMNHRLGTADSYARARVLLERARARANHPALAAWVARIDDLSARLA
jgi:tetratricopeptide (TPR) repeat protein